MTWKRSYSSKLADLTMARQCASRGDYRGWAVAHLRARGRYVGMAIRVPDDADCHLIYRIYSSCPQGYQVDHIVPLPKGEHRPENLQYLKSEANCRKARKTVFVYRDDEQLRWQDIIQ